MYIKNNFGCVLSLQFNVRLGGRYVAQLCNHVKFTSLMMRTQE